MQRIVGVRRGPQDVRPVRPSIPFVQESPFLITTDDVNEVCRAFFMMTAQAPQGLQLGSRCVAVETGIATSDCQDSAATGSRTSNSS